MESFLDEYQTVRLFVGVFGVVFIALLYFTGFWTEVSPVPNLVVMGLMGGHALWCRLRTIRSPKTMLLIDKMRGPCPESERSRSSQQVRPI